MYFETVRPHTVYQALTYLKSYNKFCKDIFIVIGLSSEEMFKFSDIFEIQGKAEFVTGKDFSNKKEMGENINGRSGTELKIP